MTVGTAAMTVGAAVVMVGAAAVTRKTAIQKVSWIKNFLLGFKVFESS